jgi:hypothetical protein
MAHPPQEDSSKPGNFLRAIIERDLEAGTYAGRHFAGNPGDAAHHRAGPADPRRSLPRAFVGQYNCSFSSWFAAALSRQGDHLLSTPH